MPARIKEIALPGCWPLVTVNANGATYHAPARAIPDVIWHALGAWQCIRDDDEADRVATRIIAAIEQAGLK